MALITLLPAPSHAAAGAGAGGTTSTGVGGSVGAGGGGGGAVVVVVLVVVDVVVLVVDDVVDAAAALRCALVLVVAELGPSPPSSRPWKTMADAETTAIAARIRAPITHARVLNRPTLCESARRGPLLRVGWVSA